MVRLHFQCADKGHKLNQKTAPPWTPKIYIQHTNLQEGTRLGLSKQLLMVLPSISNNSVSPAETAPLNVMRKKTSDLFTLQFEVHANKCYTLS